MLKFPFKNRYLNLHSQKFFFFSLFLFLILITFLVWRLKFYYFYWDEWGWLRDIAYGRFSIFDACNEHFLPVIKLLYFLQIKAIQIFKIDPLFMHYILLIMHASVSCSLGVLLYLLFRRKSLAVLGSVVFCLHPFQWENVLWNLQSQIILVAGFLIASLIFIKFYFETHKKIYYVSSLLFLILQSYSQGNGLIFPLVFILFFFLFKDKKYSLKYYIPFVALFFTNLLIYYFVIWRNVGSHYASSSITFSSLPLILDYFINGIFFNLVRGLTLINKPSLALTVVIYSIVLVGSTYLVREKKELNKKTSKIVIFSWFFYFITFVSLSLSRFNSGGYVQSFSFRYAYHYLIPLILLIGCFANHTFSVVSKTKVSKVFMYIIVIFLLGIFVHLTKRKIDFQKNIRQNAYIRNYLELKKYKEDNTYNPDFSGLCSFIPKDQILEAAETLNLLEHGYKEGEK